MDTYIKVFINNKENDQARLLTIIKLAYNAKNTSTGHMLFKLNYSYYLFVFFKKDVNLCPKSFSTNAIAKELKNLILIYQ